MPDEEKVGQQGTESQVTIDYDHSARLVADTDGQTLIGPAAQADQANLNLNEAEPFEIEAVAVHRAVAQPRERMAARSARAFLKRILSSELPGSDVTNHSKTVSSPMKPAKKKSTAVASTPESFPFEQAASAAAKADDMTASSSSEHDANKPDQLKAKPAKRGLTEKIAAKRECFSVRKERNRLAAKRSRQKKMESISYLQDAIVRLEDENHNLVEQNRYQSEQLKSLQAQNVELTASLEVACNSLQLLGANVNAFLMGEIDMIQLSEAYLANDFALASTSESDENVSVAAFEPLQTPESGLAITTSFLAPPDYVQLPFGEALFDTAVSESFSLTGDDSHFDTREPDFINVLLQSNGGQHYLSSAPFGLSRTSSGIGELVAHDLIPVFSDNNRSKGPTQF